MKELLTPEALLTNLKDVRALTRNVIEAFPEKELFEFSVANLRPFSQMVEEFLMITDYIFTEILHEKHTSFCAEGQFPTTKEGILALWDKATEIIDNEWKEIEFKSYPSFKTIIENYINDTTIGVVSTYTILLMINSFDKMVKEKNEYVSLPINSILYMVNPYTNKEMFDTKFNYSINGEDIEVFIEVNPVNKEDEVSMFTIGPLIGEFKKFSDGLKAEDVQNTIIDTIKLKLSDGFESVLTVVRLEDKEKEKLKIENFIWEFRQ